MTDPILIDVPEELVGDRVVVRAYRFGDGKALFEALEPSREHLGIWMPWARDQKTPEEQESFIRKSIASWILRENLGMAFWHRESGKYLGGTGLHRMDWEVRKFEIGYWIRPDEQGKGYVTEAVSLLTKMVFESLQANRVFIRCAESNHRSAAIPKRLGYVLEGTVHNDIRSPDGKLHNSLVFALTPETYPNAKL